MFINEDIGISLQANDLFLLLDLSKSAKTNAVVWLDFVDIWFSIVLYVKFHGTTYYDLVPLADFLTSCTRTFDTRTRSTG